MAARTRTTFAGECCHRISKGIFYSESYDCARDQSVIHLNADATRIADCSDNVSAVGGEICYQHQMHDNMCVSSLRT